MKELIGTGVALITPFTKHGAVDTTSLTRIVNFQIENGIDYLVVLGTTAESAVLSGDEKQLVKDTIISANAVDCLWSWALEAITPRQLLMSL